MHASGWPGFCEPTYPGAEEYLLALGCWHVCYQLRAAFLGPWPVELV